MFVGSMERGLIIRKRPLDPCFEHGKAALAAEVACWRVVLPFNDPPLPDLPSQTICWKVWIQGLIATSSRWQEVWQDIQSTIKTSSSRPKDPSTSQLGSYFGERTVFQAKNTKLTLRASQMRASKGGLDNVGTIARMSSSPRG